MHKQEWRIEMRRRKNGYSGDELRQLSELVVGNLLHHPRWREARTVLLYHALPDEVDTTVLFRDSLAGPLVGKTVLLPKVIDGENMELRRYTSEKDLSRGAYGIMEPKGELFTDYRAVDLAVVPGMAFDRMNNRLGRGKGYYDRLLPRLPWAYRLGICFPFQLIDSFLPVCQTDFPMDEVICSGGRLL